MQTVKKTARQYYYVITVTGCLAPKPIKNAVQTRVFITATGCLNIRPYSFASLPYDSFASIIVRIVSRYALSVNAFEQISTKKTHKG